jgi:hypothetical protein
MPASLWRIEEESLHLALHPGQARAWESKARFVAIIAGTQSGKTSFLPWWLYGGRSQRCGPGDYIAATASFDLFKLKFLPEIRTVFEHTLRCGRYWAGDRVIELADPEGKFLAKQSLVIRCGGASFSGPLRLAVGWRSTTAQGGCSG